MVCLFTKECVEAKDIDQSLVCISSPDHMIYQGENQWDKGSYNLPLKSLLCFSDPSERL